jgi:hypothetical protein
MSVRRVLGPPLALAALFGLAGCGGASLGTNVPTWAGGLPADAPSGAAEQPPFPNVYDTPPARPTRLMSEQEQAKTEAELAAIRNKVEGQPDGKQRKPPSSPR